MRGRGQEGGGGGNREERKSGRKAYSSCDKQKLT